MSNSSFSIIAPPSSSNAHHITISLRSLSLSHVSEPDRVARASEFCLSFDDIYFPRFSAHGLGQSRGILTIASLAPRLSAEKLNRNGQVAVQLHASTGDKLLNSWSIGTYEQSEI